MASNCRAVMDSTSLRYVAIWLFSKICRIHSLNYSQVIKSWDGGSENFFSLLWTSHISSYANLADHLTFVEPSPALCDQLRRARRASNDTFTSFASLLIDFLKGSGIPCPGRFEEAKGHFNKIVDLRQTDAEGFRAKMFCWATTGSCDREQGAPDIKASEAELYTGCKLTNLGGH
jgi:hypothetical protein